LGDADFDQIHGSLNFIMRKIGGLLIRKNL